MFLLRRHYCCSPVHGRTSGNVAHPPTSSSDEVSGDEKVASPLDKSSSGLEDADEKTQYVNGEPVITSGGDISRFIVDLRDDQDPPFTFRSVVLGTVIGGPDAAFDQVCYVQFFPYASSNVHL